MHPQTHDKDDRSFHLCTYGALVLALLLMTGCLSERPAHVADANGSIMVPALYFTTIAVEKPAHFPTAEGAMRLIPIGQYVVDSVDNAQLRLTPEDTPTPLVIAAALQSHDIDIPSPLVLAFAEREDEPHILLLLPDGRALDAVGSFTGIQSRDAVRANRRYSFQAETAPLPPPKPASQNEPALGTQELQNLLSNYSRAQALAQSTLATLNGRFQLEFNTDRPGGEYARRTEMSAESCRTACAADAACQAFAFVKPLSIGQGGQCSLKHTASVPVHDSCCISAQRVSSGHQAVESMGR